MPVWVPYTEVMPSVLLHDRTLYWPSSCNNQRGGGGHHKQINLFASADCMASQASSSQFTKVAIHQQTLKIAHQYQWVANLVLTTQEVPLPFSVQCPANMKNISICTMPHLKPMHIPRMRDVDSSHTGKQVELCPHVKEGNAFPWCPSPASRSPISNPANALTTLAPT